MASVSGNYRVKNATELTPDELEFLFFEAVRESDKDKVGSILQVSNLTNKKTNIGMTALHIAVQRGSLAICQLLVQHKASVNSQDLLGNTPLHEAAQSTNRLVLQFLIASGGDQTIENAHGETPKEAAESLEKANRCFEEIREEETVEDSEKPKKKESEDVLDLDFFVEVKA